MPLRCLKFLFPVLSPVKGRPPQATRYTPGCRAAPMPTMASRGANSYDLILGHPATKLCEPRHTFVMCFIFPECDLKRI